MFSIIVPLYNKSPYIRKCIQTIVSQTFTEYEVVVVNDGSTDQSLEYLRSSIYDLQFPSEKIRIIDQKNQGVSVARNTGVKLARYDYIAFLDADDWWEPTYLEEMRGLIERNPHAGLYSCGYYKVVRGKNILANIGVENDFTEGVINYLQAYAKTMYMPVTSITAIIPKSIFTDLNGFKTHLKMGEDFDLWYRVALQYPIVFLNQPLAYYNQDVEQETRAIGTKLYQAEEHMLFSDYSKVKDNQDFIRLYEVLALYGLLPYYLSGKNQKQVNQILDNIHWENHPLKYRMYYRVLPKLVVKAWLQVFKYGASLKKIYTRLKMS